MRYDHDFTELRWLPAVLVVLSVVLGYFTPGTLNTFPLLAAAPVVAAPLLSLGGTVGTGAAANLAGGLLTYLEGSDPLYLPNAIPFTSITFLTVVAALLNRLMARGRRQLRTARQVAEAVQRAVLPMPPARAGPLRVAAEYQAASEEAAIGGDLYAVHETPYGVRLFIADVRGKGVGAVRTVNKLLGTFHEAAFHVPELPEVVSRLEERARTRQEWREGEAEEVFATAVIAEFSGDGSRLRVANRGHPAPLLVHEGQALPLRPHTPSFPLGLGDLGTWEVPVDSYDVLPGATLLLYTDGVTEARDHAGVFYDPLPRLSRPTPPGPEGVLNSVLSDLARHTGGHLEDDTALLALTREDAGS